MPHTTIRGLFADAAPAYMQAGIAVVPCGGDDGKRPRVKYAHFTDRGPSAVLVEEWRHRFGGENIGILTGPSGLSVVDIDDTSLVSEMLERCGQTPLIVGTPRGGAHLYYRDNGERSQTAIMQGVDLRGRGGLIIAPCSRRPDGTGSYRFERGGIEDLAKLPDIRPGALPSNPSITSPRFAQTGAVQEGERNNWLFQQALREVLGCDDLDQLIDALRTRNEDACVPRLPDSEVVKTARSAWKIETEGRNWVGKNRRRTEIDEMLEYCDDPRAYYLREFLRANHCGVRDEFAIVSVAIAARLNWSKSTVEAKVKVLLDRGALVLTHQGGSAPGDTSLFWLGTKAPENRVQ